MKTTNDWNELPKQTAYEYWNENVSLPHPEDISILGRNVTITNKQSEEIIEKIAKALRAHNINPRDFIALGMLNQPELPNVIKALSKTGIAGNALHADFSANVQAKSIGETESKIAIITDLLFPKYFEAFKKVNLKNIVIVPSGFVKISDILNVAPNIIDINTFLERGEEFTGNTQIQYEKNIPLLAEYTSGTTGLSKGVLLPNESFSNMGFVYKFTEMDKQRGYKSMNIIPGFYSTGPVLTYMTSCFGMQMIMDPTITIENFVDMLLYYRPEIVVANRSTWITLIDNPKLENADLSFLKHPICVGEPTSQKERAQIETVFENCGYFGGLGDGWGQCELGSAVTYTAGNKTKTGEVGRSVGKTLPYMRVEAFDSKGNILPRGIEGKIKVQTPCQSIGYLNNPEATKALRDELGWNNTGDTGKVDQDNEVFIYGRDTDIIENEDGKIITVRQIRELIEQNQCVKSSEASFVRALDKIYVLVHVTLRDSCAKDFDTIQRIHQTCTRNFADLKVESGGIKIYDQFPTDKSQKRAIKEIRLNKTGFYLPVNENMRYLDYSKDEIEYCNVTDFAEEVTSEQLLKLAK